MQPIHRDLRNTGGVAGDPAAPRRQDVAVRRPKRRRSQEPAVGRIPERVRTMPCGPGILQNMESHAEAGVAAAQCRSQPVVVRRDVVRDDDIGCDFLTAGRCFAGDGRFKQLMLAWTSSISETSSETIE